MSNAGGRGEAEYVGEGECELNVGRAHLKLRAQTSHWRSVPNGLVVHSTAVTQPPLAGSVDHAVAQDACASQLQRLLHELSQLTHHFSISAFTVLWADPLRFFCLCLDIGYAKFGPVSRYMTLPLHSGAANVWSETPLQVILPINSLTRPRCGS